MSRATAVRLGVALALLGALSGARAGGIVDLGVADEFTLSQPIVQVAVSDNGRVFDIAPFNECLLDTGASGILMAKTASAELRAAGLVEVATYVDFGVAGPQATGVSAPYDFAFAGSDGVPLTMSGVRLQTSGSDFAFYGGIAGMPLMMGRTVGLDLPRQADMDALRMGVAFGSGPIAPAAHQYSIPLSMYEFPMTGRVNPDDPLPIYAPLPFAPVELQYGSTRLASSLLLDTGAQQCILSSKTAFELGLDLNGNRDLEDEAKSFQEVIGVGGTKIIPVLQIDALALRAAGGADLVLRDIAVGIIDIDDALPGVLGMNILNAGWEIYALNKFLGIEPLGPPGVFDRVDLDFRNAAATMAAEMRLTVRADADVAVSQGPLAVNVATGVVPQAAAGHRSFGGTGTLAKSGAGTLVLDQVNTLTGPTTVAAGTLEIATDKALFGSPVTVAAGATFAVAAGVTPRVPSVTLAGGTLAAGTVAVDAAAGIRTLAINAGGLAAGAALIVGDGGLVTLPTDSRLSLGVTSLDVSEAVGGGRIDLGAGELAIAAGGITATQLRADLVAGRGDGSWNGGAGIASAAAAAAGGTRAVGYVVAADGSARVSFAAPGDTNLDGAVDLLDLLSMLGSGTYDTSSAAVWTEGDFNYDGATDLLDLLGVLGSGTYDQGPYTPAATAPFGTVAAVPEPCLSWSAVMAPTVAALLRSRILTLRRPRRPAA
ncbi:MAG: autotransporter-associated beta strand repeat-containing protein [Planctomycetia bacterium]